MHGNPEDKRSKLTTISGMGQKPMTQQDLSKARDADLRASLAAMQRAAEMARQTAIQTNTSLVVVRNGKTVRIPAEELLKLGTP